MRRFIFNVVCVSAAVLMLGLAACNRGGGGGGGGRTAQSGDHLIVVVPALPVTLDPHGSADTATAYLAHQFYDSLFLTDPDTMAPGPRLAASWDMPDMQTLNIKIRDDVYFHNGDKLTAQDVAFSLKRTMASPYVGYIVTMIKDVVAQDDLNVTVLLHEPFAPILSHLAHYGTSILSERVATETGGRYHENPIGTGAFKFDSIALGDRVELSRFDQYWGDKPVFSRLTWRAMPEATNRLIEVESGNAHIALNINPSDISRAQSSPSLVLHRKDAVGAHFLGMNVRKQPFGDIRVRHAIAHALDLQTIQRVVYEGSGSFGASPISPIIWGAVRVEPFEYNPARARQLMAEAGLPNGFSTKLWYNTEDQQYAQVATIMQNQLREINVDATIQSFEWATYLELTEVGEQEMYLLSWHTPPGDADYGLYDTQSSMGWGSGNRSFTNNPEIDALLKEGRVTGDTARRLEIYKRVQELARDEAGNLYFHHTEELHVSTPNVRNFIVNPHGGHDMWRVYFAD